ncbi:MAG TPA: polyribonucleotide nucleotidyltransferase [Candidatus Latescibacteria bacterium]|jgi:polyribonucleotide nucleotidyltransferase|nr:polyribonucleotide nucleotidyltransferase [Gemmatimonadaceae bacterium]HJP30702.1 polyribonucleotide nucleotidyltransferase [Candidatus Latescibacterota bacterium]
MIHKVEMDWGGRTLSLETGKIAGRANGAVWVRYADTIVLVTACRSHRAGDRDFLPLTVEYREKAYAAGRIPGNFFKREGRMGEKETLSARMIDHMIRPLFPKKFRHEVQVFVTVLSSDGDNDADILGMVGASASLLLSDIPFSGPIAALRVGRVDGDLIVNPTNEQITESDMDLIISGDRESIGTVEGGAEEISEAALLEALEFAHENMQEILDLQEELAKKAGRDKMEYVAPEIDADLTKAVEAAAAERIAAANRSGDRDKRGELIEQMEADVPVELAEKFPDSGKAIGELLYDLTKADMRQMVLSDKKRIDGRAIDEVRELACEVEVLPRAHGSALFQRGQTQALCTATLGNKFDEKMIDDLRGKAFKSYYLDYNFPSYSTNEVSFPRGPGRREIGHGHLAEKALEPVIPAVDSFPYTLRLVADIQSSNGSTSMATVCGCSMAMMAAGIPMKAAVTASGVGLISEGDDYVILTDILGDEDFLGDMDLKVAGTEEGITAVQMENKIAGIRIEILEEALERARAGRMHILKAMNGCIDKPRAELSQFAPRIEYIKIDPSKIGAVIGPGGRMIREIEKTGASVAVDDDGTITVSAVEATAAAEARAMIEAITADAEIDKQYEGTVKRIMPFGAFVEILPGKEGLLHVSELDHHRVENVEDVVNEGDKVTVKVLDIDNSGKIRLSRKALLPKS